MAIDVAVVQATKLKGNVGDVLTKTATGVRWSPVRSEVDPAPTPVLVNIDDHIDASSSNPVQNRIIKAALDELTSALGGLPLGGTAGQVLIKTENGYAWSDMTSFPGDGAEGFLLTMNEDGELIWVDLATLLNAYGVSTALKLPPGDAGQFLMHIEGSDSYAWVPLPDVSGLPAGGAAGQVLARTSDSYSWVDALLPDGGAPNDVLARGMDGGLKWMPIPAELPEGGAPNDVLARVGEDGVGWVALDANSPTGMIDAALDASSSNPVKNKAIYAELQNKQDKLPAGAAGRYLKAGQDGLEWADVSFNGAAALPPGGTAGQVLARTSDSYSWIDALDLPVGDVGQVLALNEYLLPEWTTLESFPPGSSASDGAVYELGSKLDLVHEDAAGEARIYIGKSKNLDTRTDDVPEIDFLHTKDAMLGHEYCAVFTSEAVDQDTKPSEEVFPWVPWPVDDDEWSGSEASLSVSDPWADHPNMGYGSYEYTGSRPGDWPNLKGTGYVYDEDYGDGGNRKFWMGEPVIEQSVLYGKWRKNVALVLDEGSVGDGYADFYGQYVWDADSARYIDKDGGHKIMPIRTPTGVYSWAVADMSESDAFPEEDYGFGSKIAVDPVALRKVVWERSVDDKYVYRTVLRDDKKYSVAVADVDPACDGGGSGASCDCADELDAIKYRLMSMELELMELWALHSIAKLTVEHTPGAAPAGAAWDVDSDSNWHAFGAPAPLEAGTHSIGFKLIDGYTAPASQPVSLTAGERKTITASYTDNTPKLTVTFSGDAPEGAFWSVAPASAHTSVTSYVYGASAVLAPGSYVVRPFGYAEYDTSAAGYTWNDGLLGYPVTLALGDQVDIDIVYLGEKTAQPAAAPYTVSDAPAEVSGDYELNGSATGYGGTPVYVNDGGYYMYKVRDEDDGVYWVVARADSGINTFIDETVPGKFSYYVESTDDTPPTSGWTGCTVTAN